jgi:muramoyltetrapeptide carboxypeptidase
MLRDPSIDAIWCTDGGAGASYLLPILAKEWERQAWKPKPVLGFSDVTFLTTYLVKLGHVCFLSQNVSCEHDQHEEDLRKVLAYISRESTTRMVDHPEGVWGTGRLPVEILRPGRAQGLFLGGTFSVLANMIGTPYCPSFEGALVFFEEHGVNAPGEREYQLWDRMQGVELNGRWRGTAGFVVGEVEIGGPYETDEDLFPDLWQVLERTLLPMTGGPIVSGLPFGVSQKEFPLPVGVQAELIADRGQAELRWTIPASVWERA